MKFLKTTKEESFKIIENATMAHLTFISNFIGSLANKIDYPVNLRGKTAYIERFQKMVKDENLKVDLYKKLCRTDISKELYDTLLWKEKSISLDMFKIKFPNIDLENDTERSYEYHLTRLTGIYALLHIKDNYNNKSIFIPERIRLILKFLLPLPEDYDIETVKELKETKYTYNNEEGILSFIPAIDDMLNNDLVAFGKTAEKPLAKTLNMLNSSTSINEFYSSKPYSLGRAFSNSTNSC